METHNNPDGQLETLRARCRELDFDQIFTTKPIEGDGVEVVKIGPKALNGKTSKCSLCQGFYESSPVYHRKYSLHVRLFYFRYGCTPAT